MACVASLCVCAAFFAHEFRRRGPEELGESEIDTEKHHGHIHDGDERTGVVISGGSFDCGGGFDEGAEKGGAVASADQPTNPLRK